MIVEYRNENKFPLTINGMSSLEYIASIKGDIYSSEGKIAPQPTISLLKGLSHTINARVGKIYEK